MLTAALPIATAPATSVRHLRLAIAGCGVVGGELLKMIEQHRHRLTAHHGLHLTVARVLVRDAFRTRRIDIAPGVLTTDVEEFLATGADVVIEAIGGLDPAARIARSALTRGAHVITANKAVVAAHGSELASLARASGATLRFDAAVGGAVPVLRVLAEALGGGLPTKVRGILNGTSNFVLTRLEEGKSLEEALRCARERGFAESDASRDLDGRDAADKIAIVAWAAYGISPGTVIVRRRGLLPDPRRLVRLAEAVGGHLRLVADCELIDEGRSMVASVEPTVVRAGSAFGRTMNEENHVEVDTGWSAPLSASGPGAGGSPTATAMLSDLLAPFFPSRRRDALAQPEQDTRPFRWLIGLRGDGIGFRTALAKGGVPVAHLGVAESDAWVRTEACAWGTLAPLLPALHEPVVARDETAGIAVTEGAR